MHAVVVGDGDVGAVAEGGVAESCWVGLFFAFDAFGCWGAQFSGCSREARSALVLSMPIHMSPALSPPLRSQLRRVVKTDGTLILLRREHTPPPFRNLPSPSTLKRKLLLRFKLRPLLLQLRPQRFDRFAVHPLVVGGDVGGCIFHFLAQTCYAGETVVDGIASLAACGAGVG